MKLYIRSSACISPQNTFGSNSFLAETVEHTGLRLKAIHPDYKDFIDPRLARRMSSIIKMGVTTAMQCLNKSGIAIPGAIITGTAYGCLEDTITFLTRTIEQNEELLPPTAFIQSTHNTVAAQVALTLGCHNYNNTFVHKGLSFESALQDAIMYLNEGGADNVLAGGMDEMTDTSFTILNRLGLYKRKPVSNLKLYQEPDSKGTIGGEGAAFFLLTKDAAPENLAELVALRTLYKPADLQKSLGSFLAENSVGAGDIDLVLNGKNGDSGYDHVFEPLDNGIFKNTSLANYKHLSGEFPTSTAFALWLAAGILKSGTIPEIIFERKLKGMQPQRILIINHYQKKYYSLMLVAAV